MMTTWFTVAVLCAVQVIIVRCGIPEMVVRKVDQGAIDRKRQDTLDMCRLYKAHKSQRISKRTPHQTIEDFFSYRQIARRPVDLYPKLKHRILKRQAAYEAGPSHRRRSKRAVATAPKTDGQAMAAEDVNRLEKIIDKLYDATLDGGEPVQYIRRNLTEHKNHTAPIKSRRLNFAPRYLEAPDISEEKPTTVARPPGKTDIQVDPIDWPKNWKEGVVPYFIDTKTYDTQLIEQIQNAFNYFEKATCIRLQRLHLRPDPGLHLVQWVYISNPNGIKQCVHSNDQQINDGITQKLIVFGYNCMSLGEIVHEVMHVLGFAHEQTRPDRDRYISIMWDNIKNGYKKYFDVRATDTFLHIPYDYASVMHYPPRAFSKNGQATIHVQPGVKIGQRTGLSETDVEKVNRVYGHECLVRNEGYLERTCSLAVNSATKTQTERDEVAEHNYYDSRLWKYGIVSYKFKDKTHFSPEERDNIQAVMRHIEGETCIKFEDVSESEHSESSGLDGEMSDGVSESSGLVNDLSEEQHTPLPSDNNEVISDRDDIRRPLLHTRRHSDDFIELVRIMESGCPCPAPGRQSGEPLEIASGCFNSVNDLLHMFVHVLGLDHQHNAHDRDQYISIEWDNLTPELKIQMGRKLPVEASLGFQYDYQSVMHYPWLQIQNGRLITMYPVWNDGWSMGHWQGLSEIDVKKLQRIYQAQCKARLKLS